MGSSNQKRLAPSTRRWRDVALVVVMAGVAAGTANAQSTPSKSEGQEAKAGSREVVWRLHRTVALTGQVQEVVEVDTIMKELDRGELTIDLTAMVDSEGNRYEVSADAWQDSDSEPVHYEMTLVRYQPYFSSKEELRRDWQAAHPRASTKDFEVFLAQRDIEPKPTYKTVVGAGVEKWRAQQAGGTIDVVVRLQPSETPLNLPRVGQQMFEDEPAFALRQMKQRILRIEERKNEIASIQAPVLAELTDAGGKVLKSYWVINGFEARVDIEALAQLTNDPRVAHIDRLDVAVPDDNNLDDMREAAQIPQLHDAGVDGETSSGRSTVGDMFLAIIDTTIDVDHPAWDDWASGVSRLTDAWRFSGGTWNSVAVSATGLPSHGTKVAGNAMSDLMQGQDPAITAVADRDDRTGMAPEASFAFIENGGAGFITAIEHAISLNVDIINLSMSQNSNKCNLSAGSNDAVDEAFLDGIFFAKSASNNGIGSATCNVGNPGTASGAFTVNAVSASAVPLNTGGLGSSSRGGDALGRAVIAIAAPTGPEGPTTPQWNDTYGGFGATSGATPVVAGAAAVLKDHLIDVFSTATANNVGWLYASMLLMGDGQLEDGTIAAANDPLDEVWGAGRLRMRMFNSAGMDTPWRMRLISRTISDGELAADLMTNPSGGVEQPLSNDVERLRAAAMWHEPNIEDATGQAMISLYICNELGNCYTSGNASDPRQRLRLGNVVGGHEWTIRLHGLDVPISLDSNYRFLRDERVVWVAVYWEDTDRDDGDGPSADIQ